jgi:hypothetical protein
MENDTPVDKVTGKNKKNPQPRGESGKKVTAARETQNDKDNTAARKALEKLINIKKHIPAFTGFKDETFLSHSQIAMRDMRPMDQLDDRSKEAWERAMIAVQLKYITPQSKQNDVSFDNQANNINKFLGNVLGNKVRKYTNTMTKYYTGKQVKQNFSGHNLTFNDIITFFCLSYTR